MKTVLILLLSLLINAGCTKDFSDYYPYNPPFEKKDGLRVGTLPEVQMDSQMILKAVGRIKQGKYGEIHSMLIYKDDRLVFEEYYGGHQYQWDAPNHYGNYVMWNGDMQHCIHSDSKSFVSLCIGIAVDKGFINSVNQSIFDYLPDHQHLKTGDKEKITIEHLLTMSSGLEWEE